MKNYDLNSHVQGKSLFIDDLPVPERTLFAEVFDSSIAHGEIIKLDLFEACKVDGVAAIFTSKDIPGENQIGGIIQDETLLADGEVQFIGEPIALIVAESKHAAKEAKKRIKIEYKEKTPITDPREAYKLGLLIHPPRIFECGNVEESFKNCKYVFDGRVDIGGQEHLYLETQGAVAIPNEDGGIKLFSSTQSPTAVQRTAAKVLDLLMNKVEVDVLRLGGAFGGKEDQATVWAVLAALGAHKLKRPVKLVLSREDDLRMTGKRHPYSADYKIGFDKKNKIAAYEVVYYQNSGAVADLSSAILERTLFHAANTYFIPNLKATGFPCKTNLPPFTAFRGFGGPQAMFVIESAIHKAASELGIDASEIQENNLIKRGDTFHYGQKAELTQAKECWETAKEKFQFSLKQKEAQKFNNKNERYKKGIALMPICFGISFTSSFLNQASALVHVYTDGSVGVSTAAIEMGQGVNTKIAEVVSRVFSIDKSRIKIESTNTTRIANTSPTAASSGADLNGNAAISASKEVLKRLIEFASQKFKTDNKNISIDREHVMIKGKKSELTWNKIISEAYFNRVSLSAHSFYSTPQVYFNRETNKGNPFAYHVYGTAIVVAKIDCLLGTYEIESADIVHDFGKSLVPVVDLGQVEGGLAQGIGWLTMEELVYNSDGKLASNSLSTYKVPDIYSVPKELNVHFHERAENKFGPFNSKAVGEPPFMYGIGAYFALLNAIKAARPNKRFDYTAPLTPEKVLLSLFR
ncbi:MAG: molybdopterin cofactor-binding domain-containing protein [Bacteroidota bacterium]